MSKCSKRSKRGFRQVSQRTAELEHYVKGPPLSGMLQLAGGEAKYKESYQPPRTAVAVPNELISAIFDRCLVDRQRVHQEYFGASKAERKRRGLYAAKSVVDTIYLSIVRMFQMLASRPVDPVTNVLRQDERTFLIRFRYGTFSDILTHPVFDTMMWAEFQQRVNAAEDTFFGINNETTLCQSINPEINRLANQQYHQDIVAKQRHHSLMTILQDLASRPSVAQPQNSLSSANAAVTTQAYSDQNSLPASLSIVYDDGEGPSKKRKK
jgi:hypothetical protein